jgi:hypothetical protein
VCLSICLSVLVLVSEYSDILVPKSGPASQLVRCALCTIAYHGGSQLTACDVYVHQPQHHAAGTALYLPIFYTNLYGTLSTLNLTKSIRFV